MVSRIATTFLLAQFYFGNSSRDEKSNLGTYHKLRGLYRKSNTSNYALQTLRRVLLF